MPKDRSRFSLLLVDDEPSQLTLLEKALAGQNYLIRKASNGREALALLGDMASDAAIIDLNMPGMDGFSLLRKIKKGSPQTMVIMVTGFGGVREAVEAIKLGAVDFVEKPYSAKALRARIAQLHQIWELREENRELRERMEFRFGFDQLVGNSTAMLKLKQSIAQVGPTDATILIQGETGVGKEVVARAIHHHSPRSERGFVPVDCSAISEGILESELFGHERGAFTGAHLATPGLFRSAHKGTLFLDEVAELPRAI